MYLCGENKRIFSINEVQRKKNKVIHNGITYSMKEWYINTSAFRNVSGNNISLVNQNILVPKSYLREMFKLNARKHTFLGLILPCIVFLLISLMIKCVRATSQVNGIFNILEINQTSILFLDFIMYVFLFISLGLLYKLIIKRTKLIYTRIGRAEGYKHISKEKYTLIMKQLGTLDYIYFEPIKTERLIIRELEDKDISDYYYFASSEIVHKHLSSSPLKSVDDAISIINNARSQYHEKLIYKLAIIRRSDDKLIGYIGLSTHDLSLSTCQIVYAIHQDYWGNGYVSEALKAFVNYLKSIGKTLIIAGHVDENQNSGKVLLKNGFIRDPSRDNQMIIHGELKNIISYTIDERKK